MIKHFCYSHFASAEGPECQKSSKQYKNKKQLKPPAFVTIKFDRIHRTAKTNASNLWCAFNISSSTPESVYLCASNAACVDTLTTQKLMHLSGLCAVAANTAVAWKPITPRNAERRMPSRTPANCEYEIHKQSGGSQRASDDDERYLFNL